MMNRKPTINNSDDKTRTVCDTESEILLGIQQVPRRQRVVG